MCYAIFLYLGPSWKSEEKAPRFDYQVENLFSV